MKKFERLFLKTQGLIVLVFSIGLAGCVSLAGYDQHAYENATSLKANTMGQINTFGVSFSYDKVSKNKLFVELESAFEYANGVQHNNEASKAWRWLIDDIVQGYFQLCITQEGKISKAAFNEYMPQVGEAFDNIICLEANKRSLTNCPSPITE